MKSRALFLYAFAYLAFLYVPVLLLPVFSFNNSAVHRLSARPASPPAGIGELAADSAMQHALGNSLKVGAGDGAAFHHAGACRPPRR